LAGFPAKRNGRRSVSPPETTSPTEANARPPHTNPSPNPCKGNQPETPGKRKHWARFATQLYPIRRQQTMTQMAHTTALYVGIDVSQNTRTIAIYPTDEEGGNS